ncbi:MBL fold metallo-hydrolase [Myxococcota bacterium]|nr:MBL fold metallo-hydrolase [Myxococcota bacterium]
MSMNTPDARTDQPRETRIGDRIWLSAPGVYRIVLTTGYETGDVNVWLLDGDEPVLFDAGTGTDASNNELRGALADIGRRMTDIRMLLLTHAHIDHCGGAGVVAGEAGCPVLVHESELRRVRDFKAVSRVEVEAMAPVLDLMGFEGDVGDRARTMLDSLSSTAVPCPDAMPLPEVVDVGGRRISWSYRPGHSPADVVFLMDDMPLAFTGDHILPHVASSPALDYRDQGMYHQALPRYRASLVESASLTRLTGCPGHGATFADVGARARMIMRTQEIRLSRVRGIVTKTGARTVFQVTCELFGRNFRWEILMLANETAGYLKVLTDEGVVAMQRAPGVPDRFIPMADGSVESGSGGRWPTDAGHNRIVTS